MATQRTPLLAAALAAALLFAGCVGSQGSDTELASNAVQADVVVAIEADQAGEASHLGLELDRVLAHDANVSLPDGFHELSLETSHADLVHDGEATRVELASGSVPAGGYDQILLRVDNATVQTNASGGGHDHGGGDDGHAHDHGANASGETIQTGAFALPVNASFEAVPGETTHVTFVLDVAESLDGDSLSPSFAKVKVERGNETVATLTNLETRAGPSDNDLPSDPPATRIAVFAPNGDKVYEPAFDPDDGVFANSESAAFSPGAEVTFSASESEPVAKGAALESYEWDFGDGDTATGRTASHAFETQGVFEVELEVADSYGNVGTHMVRVVVLQTEWTTTLVETSFEDGEENWTTASSGSAPSEEAETTWALDGAGYNSSTAWHVGHHAAHPQDEGVPAGMYPGYTSNAQATLTSPTFTIPEEWTNAGYSFFVGGASEPDYDPLEITYSVDGNATQVATVDATNGWTEFSELEGLGDAIGKDVQFTFTFTSDGNTERGPGFYMDAFVIGGVDIPMQNADLLEASGGGHDGHDHEH